MNYIIDHIQKNTPCNRRPGNPLDASTITIHNTGNPSSSARNERDWLTNASNDRVASFHIVLDEIQAIECLPLNENAWAAGDGENGPGNRTSIHIEICESGDYEQTIQHAIDLVAKMLKERGWGVDQLRRHFDWSGKICPRLMYDNGTWATWQRFKRSVSAKLERDEVEMKEEIEGLKQQVEALQKLHTMPIPDWAEDAIDAAVKGGYIDTPDGGSLDFYRFVTVMHRTGAF